MNSIGPGPHYRGLHHHHHNSPGGPPGGGGRLGPFNSSPSSYQGSTPVNQKPKVGLAVVCRCAAGNTYVQCLLQRRGMHSSSPNKWSFPGGRLEQAGDLEDDGAVGTQRELNEECGGGAPLGLPPLIHIECCKTGKVGGRGRERRECGERGWKCSQLVSMAIISGGAFLGLEVSLSAIIPS